MTYGNTNFDAAAYALKSYKKNFDYAKTLLTVDNYLPAFDMSKEKATEKHTDENLKMICDEIAKRKVYKPKMKLKNLIVDSFVQKYFSKHRYALDGSQLEISDKCIGCGLCEKVCPKGNIIVENGMAKRKNVECEFCLACANLCPQKAIICSISDVNPNERYINPNVSVKDIIDANEQ